MEHNEEFDFLSERKKFIDNLEQSNRMREKMLAMMEELKSLYQELALTKGDTHSLTIKLNSTALELGLQPIEIKRIQR